MSEDAKPQQVAEVELPFDGPAILIAFNGDTAEFAILPVNGEPSDGQLYAAAFLLNQIAANNAQMGFAAKLQAAQNKAARNPIILASRGDVPPNLRDN